VLFKQLYKKSYKSYYTNLSKLNIDKITNIYQARVACDSNCPFGIGMQQWSDSTRKNNLLSFYEEEAALSGGLLSEESLIRAECETIKKELESKDASEGGFYSYIFPVYERTEPQINDMGEKISFSTCLLYREYERPRQAKIAIGDNYTVKDSSLWIRAQNTTSIMSEEYSICARIIAAKAAYEHFLEEDV